MVGVAVSPTGVIQPSFIGIQFTREELAIIPGNRQVPRVDVWSVGNYCPTITDGAFQCPLNTLWFPVISVLISGTPADYRIGAIGLMLICKCYDFQESHGGHYSYCRGIVWNFNVVHEMADVLFLDEAPP